MDAALAFLRRSWLCHDFSLNPAALVMLSRMRQAISTAQYSLARAGGAESGRWQAGPECDRPLAGHWLREGAIDILLQYRDDAFLTRQTRAPRDNH